MPPRTKPLRQTTELRRSPLQRSSVLSSVSYKRQKDNGAYRKLRREFLEARPWCEYPDCVAPATDVHHRKGRVGALLLDVTHWSAMCRTHHAHITVNPAEAYALGLSERRVGAL